MFQKQFLKKQTNYTKYTAKKRMYTFFKTCKYDVVDLVCGADYLNISRNFIQDNLDGTISIVTVLNEQYSEIKNIDINILDSQNTDYIQYMFRRCLRHSKFKHCILTDNLNKNAYSNYFYKMFWYIHGGQYRISYNFKYILKRSILNNTKLKICKIKTHAKLNLNIIQLQQFLLSLLCIYGKDVLNINKFYNLNPITPKVQSDTGIVLESVRDLKKRRFFSSKAIFLSQIY